MKPYIIPEPVWLKMREGGLRQEGSVDIFLSRAGNRLVYQAAKKLRDSLGRCDIPAEIERRGTLYDTRGTILLVDLETDTELLSGVVPGPEAIEGKGPEAYIIDISSEHAVVAGNSAAGVWNGVQSLIQILEQSCFAGGEFVLPALRIEDYPALSHRGVMLDISREKVPSLQTLKRLVDIFSRFKINMFQLYTEHTFRFRKHPLIGADAGGLRPEEILELDEYCRDRNVDLVPNLNSFGHMHHILKLDPYKHLAESERLWTISPAVEETYTFLDELFSEFVPNFSSRFFNIGCDETFDLGEGKSKALAEEKGLGRVYLEHILRLYDLVTNKYNKTVMIWGDIILKYPDLIPELPKDIVMLNWGYEATHPFETVEKFAEAEVPQIVCPGTSSWNSLFPRIENSRINIRKFVAHGVKAGAIGCLNTDWGDGGHYNLQGYSWYGYLYGAEHSWAPGKVSDSDFNRKLGRVFFGDREGLAVGAVEKLGRASEDFEVKSFNSSLLMWMFFQDIEHEKVDPIKTESIKKARQAARTGLEMIEDLLAEWEDVFADLDENSSLSLPVQVMPESLQEEIMQVLTEMAFAARQSIHACDKTLVLRRAAELGDGEDQTARAACIGAIERLVEDLDWLEATFQDLWLDRSHPEGLETTLKRYDRIRQSYLKAIRELDS